jgi:hypothetical protein
VRWRLTVHFGEGSLRRFDVREAEASLAGTKEYELE